MSFKYVEFKISPVEEAKNLPKIFDLAGKWILTPSLRERFSTMSEKEILLEVKKLHKGNKKRFENIKAIYEKMWKEVGEEYIKNIEKILDWKIKDKKICYIVPSLWGNIAEVLGKKNCFIVAAEQQQNPLDFLMLHELTHLYYSDVLTNLNLLKAYNSPLMEGVDHLILFKTPIKKLFKGKKYEEVSFVVKNKKFMGELERAWEKRKNFKTFLEKAIKIQDKFPNVVIC
jgi:hypothetical protein